LLTTVQRKEREMRNTWMAWLAIGVVLLPGVVAGQTVWVDDPANPVLVPGSPGTWDAWSYINEVVLVDGTYHMFYMGQEEGSPFGFLFDIGHATSPDGSSWTLDPANPVLVRDAGGWDSDSVAFPAVLHDGTEFRMWYIGSDGEVDAVGYATSADGTTSSPGAVPWAPPSARAPSPGGSRSPTGNAGLFRDRVSLTLGSTLGLRRWRVGDPWKPPEFCSSTV
jgi:hypothetical protein